MSIIENNHSLVNLINYNLSSVVTANQSAVSANNKLQSVKSQLNSRIFLLNNQIQETYQKKGNYISDKNLNIPGTLNVDSILKTREATIITNINNIILNYIANDTYIVNINTKFSSGIIFNMPFDMPQNGILTVRLNLEVDNDVKYSSIAGQQTDILFHVPGIYQLIFKKLDGIVTMSYNVVPSLSKYSSDCLKFTAIQAGSTIKLVKYDDPYNVRINYYDSVSRTWNQFINNDDESVTITLAHVGDFIYLKGETQVFSNEDGHYKFEMTGKIAAAGNIMSLINFKTLTGYGQFQYLFQDCVSLISAPELAANTLTQNCYTRMFQGCINLTSAPRLPATNLAESCYELMFIGCTSLVNAPILSATNLEDRSYDHMFYGCTSLSSVNVKFTSWNIDYTEEWLCNVSSKGIFTCLPALSEQRGVSYIPSNWLYYRIGYVAANNVNISSYMNENISYQIQAYAGSQQIRYSSNNLPNQLTLTSGGLISGMFTSKTSGQFNVLLEANNHVSKTINCSYEINDIPMVTPIFYASFSQNNNWITQTGQNFSNHGNNSYYYDSTIGRYCVQIGGDRTLSFTPSNFPTGNSPFTISVNIKISTIDSGSKNAILSFGSTPWSNTVAAIAIDNSRYFYAANWSNWNIKYQFNLNTWYKVTATFDGTTTKLYINNNLVSSGSISYNIGTAKCGINTWWASNYWTGYIYNCRIYNVALTQDQIQTF